MIITNKQKEYFAKEIEAINKEPTGILELKNSIKEVTRALESNGNRGEQVELKSSEL